jgi:hypothetical protein
MRRKWCEHGLSSAKGVTFTQFIATPAGWKMTVMAWDDERPGLDLADRYRDATP